MRLLAESGVLGFGTQWYPKRREQAEHGWRNIAIALIDPGRPILNCFPIACVPILLRPL